MNDSTAFPERLRHDRNQIVRLDKLTSLIHKHRTIRITIEYHTAVEPLLPDQSGYLRTGLSLQRIRTVMRKVSVRNIVYDDGVRKKALRQNTGGPVAAIDRELQP